jgi:hypothetical protein
MAGAGVSSLLPEGFGFEEETFAQVSTRYAGFGRGVFTALEAASPAAFAALRFYRATIYQQGDVYAVCRWGDGEVAIQLDPDCEVICVWDRGAHVEIGAWAKDPEAAAVAFIGERLGTPLT